MTAEPVEPGATLTVTTDEAGLAVAEAALLAGRPVIVPTDTVYGLAVIAGDPAALERLFELKARPEDRSIAVLVADLAQAETLAVFNEAARQAAAAHWPGALTLVVDRHAHVDGTVGRADGTVGIRCPGDEFCRELAGRVGPLATTSANRSGRPTPADAAQAGAQLTGPVAVIVDDGPIAGEASTVARIGPDGRATVFRPGPVVV